MAERTMADLLRDLDAKATERREANLSSLAVAAAKGISIVADHRMSDGNIAVLVSPGDYARLKEYQKCV